MDIKKTMCTVHYMGATKGKFIDMVDVKESVSNDDMVSLDIVDARLIYSDDKPIRLTFTIHAVDSVTLLNTYFGACTNFVEAANKTEFVPVTKTDDLPPVRHSYVVVDFAGNEYYIKSVSECAKVYFVTNVDNSGLGHPLLNLLVTCEIDTAVMT